MNIERVIEMSKKKEESVSASRKSQRNEQENIGDSVGRAVF